ncbi:MAG: hypothetical protein OHK0053_37900 [Microscillaceae bacterium]
MSARIFLLSLMGLMPFVALAQSSKMVKTKVNDYISLLLPSDFSLMPAEEYARRFGAYRPPLAMYQNQDGNVHFGINQSQNRSLRAYAEADFKAEDLEMLKGMYKASIAALHTEVNFLQDKVINLNKRDYIVLEFVGLVKDEDNAFGSGKVLRQYSYLMYTVENDQVLVFNFTCPQLIQQKWAPVAQQIMQSLKVGLF